MNLTFKEPLLHAKLSLLETSNLESNAHDEDDFKSCSHDDHLSILDYLIAYGSQEYDSYEDPRAYSPKKPCSSLVRVLYK